MMKWGKITNTNFDCKSMLDWLTLNYAHQSQVPRSAPCSMLEGFTEVQWHDDLQSKWELFPNRSSLPRNILLPESPFICSRQSKWIGTCLAFPQQQVYPHLGHLLKWFWPWFCPPKQKIESEKEWNEKRVLQSRIKHIAVFKNVFSSLRTKRGRSPNEGWILFLRMV